MVLEVVVGGTRREPFARGGGRIFIWMPRTEAKQRCRGNRCDRSLIRDIILRRSDEQMLRWVSGESGRLHGRSGRNTMKAHLLLRLLIPNQSALKSELNRIARISSRSSTRDGQMDILRHRGVVRHIFVSPQQCLLVCHIRTFW